MLEQIIRAIRRNATAVLAGAGLALVLPVAASRIAATPDRPPPEAPAPVPQSRVEARTRADLAAMRRYRPGYAFWQHVFTIRDGSIAFGSAIDGRLLAVFPARGDWARNAIWVDPSLARVLDDRPLARDVRDRREQVELLLERAVGPVLHNATRGDALRPNARRFGSFVAEWGAIYERFGVPADIGLAQAILESGLSPRRRSEANAVGFCQWLQRNWRRLDYFSPTPLDGRNQTTQAPYCAAYLSVLATKYGSFIPALSEHNAGGTNVGRMLITGEYVGADDVRARYFLASELARGLRGLPGRTYTTLHGTYGSRSHRYAEMVFGNTLVYRQLIASTYQTPIHAMRTPRALSLADIVRRTGLTADEVRRFNPALVDRVPAQGTLYLPYYISEFGADVAFWRRPPGPSYAAVLDDFLALDAGFERWDDPAFERVLTGFRRRFIDTETEEGAVMGTVLAYAMDQAYTSSRRTLLSDFRRSQEMRRLIERGMLELDVVHSARAETAAAAAF